VTLDNEEAEIKIAQEVPFITGQYAQTAGGVTGGVNPFTTVQREEVGNILKLTPQINEGTAVLLKISQEASSIAASSQQVSQTDLITNKPHHHDQCHGRGRRDRRARRPDFDEVREEQVAGPLPRLDPDPR
jgi:hypothetical protein